MHIAIDSNIETELDFKTRSPRPKPVFRLCEKVRIAESCHSCRFLQVSDSG